MILSFLLPAQYFSWKATSLLYILDTDNLLSVATWKYFEYLIMCSQQRLSWHGQTNNYLFIFSRNKRKTYPELLIGGGGITSNSIFQAALYDTTPLFWANLVNVSLQDVMSQVQHLLSVQFSFLPAEPECHESMTTPGGKKKTKTCINRALLGLSSSFFSSSESHTWGHRETCHPDLPPSTSTTPWKRRGLTSCCHHSSATEKVTAAPGGAQTLPRAAFLWPEFLHLRFHTTCEEISGRWETEYELELVVQYFTSLR